MKYFLLDYLKKLRKESFEEFQKDDTWQKFRKSGKKKSKSTREAMSKVNMNVFFFWRSCRRNLWRYFKGNSEGISGKKSKKTNALRKVYEKLLWSLRKTPFLGKFLEELLKETLKNTWKIFQRNSWTKCEWVPGRISKRAPGSVVFQKLMRNLSKKLWNIFKTIRWRIPWKTLGNPWSNTWGNEWTNFSRIPQRIFWWNL